MDHQGRNMLSRPATASRPPRSQDKRDPITFKPIENSRGPLGPRGQPETLNRARQGTPFRPYVSPASPDYHHPRSLREAGEIRGSPANDIDRLKRPKIYCTHISAADGQSSRAQAGLSHCKGTLPRVAYRHVYSDRSIGISANPLASIATHERSLLQLLFLPAAFCLFGVFLFVVHSSWNAAIRFGDTVSCGASALLCSSPPLAWMPGLVCAETPVLWYTQAPTNSTGREKGSTIDTSLKGIYQSEHLLRGHIAVEQQLMDIDMSPVSFPAKDLLVSTMRNYSCGLRDSHTKMYALTRQIMGGGQLWLVNVNQVLDEVQAAVPVREHPEVLQRSKEKLEDVRADIATLGPESSAFMDLLNGARSDGNTAAAQMAEALAWVNEHIRFRTPVLGRSGVFKLMGLSNLAKHLAGHSFALSQLEKLKAYLSADCTPLAPQLLEIIVKAEEGVFKIKDGLQHVQEAQAWLSRELESSDKVAMDASRKSFQRAVEKLQRIVQE